MLIGLLFSRCAALGWFLVQQRGGGGRAAPSRYFSHDDDERACRSYVDTQFVAGTHAVSVLGAYSGEVNLATADRRARKTAGLEEARRPQPFVEGGIVIVVGRHIHGLEDFHT